MIRLNPRAYSHSHFLLALRYRCRILLQNIMARDFNRVIHISGAIFKGFHRYWKQIFVCIAHRFFQLDNVIRIEIPFASCKILQNFLTLRNLPLHVDHAAKRHTENITHQFIKTNKLFSYCIIIRLE